MIDELIAALRRVGAWLLAIALGGFVLLMVLRALLPALARTATLFLVSPGGLFICLVVWWWITRHKRK